MSTQCGGSNSAASVDSVIATTEHGAAIKEEGADARRREGTLVEEEQLQAFMVFIDNLGQEGGNRPDQASDKVIFEQQVTRGWFTNM